MTTIDASTTSTGMAALLSAVEMESSSGGDQRHPNASSELGNASMACMSKTEAIDVPKSHSVTPTSHTSKPSLKKRWLEREDSNRSNLTKDTEVTLECDACSISCATLSDSVIICDTSNTASPLARGSVMDDGRSYQQECDDARSSSYLSNRPMKKRRHFLHTNVSSSGDHATSSSPATITSDDQKFQPGEAVTSCASGQPLQPEDDAQQALLAQQELLSKVSRQASSRITASLQLGRRVSLSLSSSSSSSSGSDSPPHYLTTAAGNAPIPASTSLSQVDSYRRHWASSSSSAAARCRRALRAHYAQDAAQLLAGVENMQVSSTVGAANAPTDEIPSMSSQTTLPMTAPTSTVAPTPTPTTITTNAPIVQSPTSHYELNRHTSKVVSSAIEALQKSQSIHFTADPIAPMPQLDAVLRRRRLSLDAVSTTSRTRLAVEAGIVVGTNKGAAAATATVLRKWRNGAANGCLDSRPATIAGIGIPYYLQRVTAGGARL